MDEADDTLLNVTNLLCSICGENNFDVLEGYYYCKECGTKQEQIRDIEVDQEQLFTEGRYTTKVKLKKAETTNVELTSWECYNYILRGMVEDLLNLGAKEELKLTALQVWAAYLRRNEVAFFSKKQSDLPKLGVRYFKRDARTIYNHRAEKQKNKRVRIGSHKMSDEQQKHRAWKKSKRKLDESVYSIKSNATIGTHFTEATLDTTNQDLAALQLQYSKAARKSLKKIMPLKHLAKHELDEAGALKCHNMRLTKRSLPLFYANSTTMSIKLVYAILGISLNLINDDIQLSDFTRFIAEEHISTRNVLQYLPENVRENGRQLLQDIDFNIFPDKYSNKAMREHISLLGRAIPIIGFNKPDIFELAQRYIMDLNLPPDFAQFVERLINILPPEMDRRSSPFHYPQYEARAMAYIIFIAKLLFGLDGEKERAISDSAIGINKQLRKLKETTSAGLDGRHQPLLFVWSEWVEYIEMRKLIISRYNANYCCQFKQQLATSTFNEDLRAKENQQKDIEFNHREQGNEQRNVLQDNVRRIFETLLTKMMESYKDQPDLKKDTHISFQASLMPSHNYFKRLVLHDSNSNNEQSIIPEFMRVNHTQRALNPFVDASTLSQYLASCGWQLHIEELECTSNRNYIGIFRNNRKRVEEPLLFKPNTNITTEEWLKEIEKEQKQVQNGITFVQKLKLYCLSYRRSLNIKSIGSFDQKYDQSNISLTQEQEQTLAEHSEILACPSYEVYSEEDMKPLDFELPAPRRNMDSEDILKEYRDDDDDCKSLNQSSKNYMETVTKNGGKKDLNLRRSNFDYWTLFGYTLMSVEEKNDLLEKLPLSFIWLLENCSQMIDVDWYVVYEQLLVLELNFTEGIANLDNFKDCLYYTYNNPVRDINVLTKSYRELW